MDAMSLHSILGNLGLNQKQADIFLALVKLGPSPVRLIAQQAGVNRGTTYDTLKYLLTKGLISYYHRDKHQYFVAESPTRLTELIEDRIRQSQETKAEIEKRLPELEALYATPGEKPVVKYYEGFRGAKTILRDVLAVMSRADTKEYFVYSSVDLRDYLYQEFPNFTDERVKHGIKVRTISIGAGGQLHGLDARRWLSRKEGAPNYVIIYDNKLAVIGLDANRNLMGILIESRSIAETQALIFRNLWDKLEPSA